MINAKRLSYFNTFMFLVMILVNALANIIPINGYNTGQVSDFYPSLFTPAPITFSIWGVIYITLGIFIAYQLGWIKGTKTKQSIENIGILFGISCFLNILWILNWHYMNIGATLMIMVLLLLNLIAIYLKLRSYGFIDRQVEKWCVMLPFSLYLGWISVATIANVSVWFIHIGFKSAGFMATFWTLALLVVAGMLAVQMVKQYKDYAYAGVILWTYIGVLIRWIHYEKTPNFVIIVGVSVLLGMVFSNIKIFKTKI